MGLLEYGTPLPWPLSLRHVAFVREHGVRQFLNTYARVKDATSPLLWGDEIEYHLVRIGASSAQAALIAPEVLVALENEDKRTKFPILSAWRPEFGAWMIEATPGVPYGGSTADLRSVERNMAMRRFRIARMLPHDVHPFSIVNFPLLGAGNAFLAPARPAGGPFSRSAYLSDACISPHPRFGTLTASIRRRRGRKVDIQMPLYRDRATAAFATPSGSGGRLGDLAAVTTITDSRFLGASEAFGSGGAEASNSGDGGGSLSSAGQVELTAHTEATRRFGEAESEDAAAAGVASSSAAALLDTAIGPAVVAVPGHIHMDAMAFGMGCCCLQVTFQARDLHESRYLYDQLAVMSPLMLALTANAPIWRGHLGDLDTRWDVIAASVDCRTPAERGFVGADGRDVAASTAASAAAEVEAAPAWMAMPLASNAAAGGTRRIAKSRYSSIDCFISEDAERLPDAYNDLPLKLDAQTFDMCRAAGLDERLARHVAHLFIRDPLVIFSERVDLDDAHSVEHFENVQSTNWRSMRWKPPPADAPSIGWRVELRTMEAQITDFENAAFTVFVALLSRAMLFFDMNLYIPLSKVDENFSRARLRRAASHQRFWFRRRITERRCSPGPVAVAAAAAAASSVSAGSSVAGSGAIAGATASAPAPCFTCGPPASSSSSSSSSSSTEAPGVPELEFEEMTLAEILLGKGADAECPGLIPLIHLYLDFIQCDEATRVLVEGYLRFIAGRATGDIVTGASWQRSFVRSHAEYRHDSVVPPAVAADLLRELQAVTSGQRLAPELLGVHAPPALVITEAELRAPAPQQPGVPLHVLPGEARAAAAADSSPAAPFPAAALAGGGGAPEMALLVLPSPAAPAAPATTPTVETGRVLRGGSFADEEDLVYECAALRRIVDKYQRDYGLSPTLRSHHVLAPDSPMLHGLAYTHSHAHVPHAPRVIVASAAAAAGGSGDTAGLS